MVTHLIRLEDFRPQFPKPHLLLAVSRSVFVETEIVTNSCNKPKILYSTCHQVQAHLSAAFLLLQFDCKIRPNWLEHAESHAG